MTDPLNQIPTEIAERLKEHKPGLFRLGIALALLGAIMVIFPVVGSITTKVFIGVFFLLAGGAMLWQAFQARTWESAIWTGLVALLHLALGVYLSFFPLTGLIGLTLLMGIAFAIQGVLELRVAFQNKQAAGWNWMILSGIASLILSVMLVLGLPGTALWALGLMVGLNLLTTGIGFIALSRSI